MQLCLQGFWYGLLSTAITYVEDGRTIKEIEDSPKELCTFVDSEFDSWATEWLQTFLDDFLTLSPTTDELHHLLERFDELFRDCIPGDLQIFTTLTSGSELTSEQWARLYDALAFTNQIDPNNYNQHNQHNQHNQLKSKNKQKTRCTHGRRAITPMRSRRALTRKRRLQPHSSVHVFKVNQ
jgi:hypothetical protein